MLAGKNLWRARIALLIFALAATGCHQTPTILLEHDRFRLDARMEGRPLQLIFDTGADDAMLLRPTAEKLGLKITEAPPDSALNPGQVPAGLTEPCRMDLLSTVYQGPFHVIDMPPGIRPDFDGVLGWQTLKDNVLVFDLTHARITLSHSLPDGVGSWPNFLMVKNQKTLGLSVQAEGDSPQTIMIDTGDTDGVGLSPEQWRRWRMAHPQAPTTLTAYYTPGSGIVVSEECWADEISLGRLTLKNVPVMQASPSQTALGGPGFIGEVGLYGLSRLELVTDGKWGVAYVRPINPPAKPYNHNRLGAVFVPQELSGGPLLARVLPGSPADEAGIRNGDELRRIGTIDATRWNDPYAKFSASLFWGKPAGTRLELTLLRSGKEFQTTVVLRDLIGPGSHGARPGD